MGEQPSAWAPLTNLLVGDKANEFLETFVDFGEREPEAGGNDVIRKLPAQLFCYFITECFDPSE